MCHLPMVHLFCFSGTVCSIGILKFPQVPMLMTSTKKSARRYSVEAHKLLARLGHAPRPRAVTTLPGSWIMVVMVDLSPYLSLGDPTLVLSDWSRRMVLSKVTDIVQTLHKNHLVHGDILSTNLLATIKPLRETRTLRFIYWTSVVRGGLSRSSTSTSWV
ncbi:hypothetical protein BJV78DRAFT_944763 [Lactifluus subvellereus]|nr:hypothetical protein BJV78DRAFT_944763 [Lactifluus subvellereus]